jgi:CRP-like cAMP-binding protein
MCNEKENKKLQDHLKNHQLEAVFNEEMMANLALYKFEKGQHICRQGEPSDVLYFLVEGKVKIYTSSVEGKTLILSFKTHLDVIGDIEYVQEIATINTVEAVSPVVMIGVPYDVLKKHASNHVPLLQFLLKAITKKFYMKSNAMNMNVLYPVEVRLASYLLSVTFDVKEPQVNGKISTRSLTDIANLIGTSYRHVNRVIQKLCADEILERKEKFVRIKDREALKTLAGENIYE